MSEVVGARLPLPSRADPCPHCDPGRHVGGSWRPSWAVYVAPERDRDGQPIRLHVQPTAGAHVAEEDAEWLRELIRRHGHDFTVGQASSHADEVGRAIGVLDAHGWSVDMHPQTLRTTLFGPGPEWPPEVEGALAVLQEAGWTVARTAAPEPRTVVMEP